MPDYQSSSIYFYRLPRDIILLVLGEFLHLHEIARLDSASTNKADRSQLLQCLQTPSLQLHWKHKTTFAQLQYLVVRSIRIDVLRLAKDKWKELVDYLRLLDNKTAWGSVSTVEIDGNNGQCEKVTELILSNCCPAGKSALRSVHIRNQKKMPDSALQLLVSSALPLEELHMSSCWKISDTVVSKLVSPASLTLRSLDLSACFAISEAGFVAIVRSCRKLREFKASYCTAITNNVIEQLLSHNDLLESLDVAGCVALTDDMFLRIDDHALHLRSLDISQIKNFTDAALGMLRRALPNLREIYMLECGRISSEAANKLAVASPQLQIVRTPGA